MVVARWLFRHRARLPLPRQDILARVSVRAYHGGRYPVRGIAWGT